MSEKKFITLEQALMQAFAPDSSLFDMCLDSQVVAVRYLMVLKNRLTPHSGEVLSTRTSEFGFPIRDDTQFYKKLFSSIIRSRLAEALTSPVPWVRDLALEANQDDN